MQIAAQGVFVGDAKFVALQSSGDIGVGLWVHIGVDADAHRCDFAAGQRYFAEYIQLCFAFHIEASDTRI